VSGETHSGKSNRREVLAKGAGAALAVGLAGNFASTASGASRAPFVRGRRGHEGPRPPVGEIVLETVTGPIVGADVTFAMAHEHLFVDFLGPTDPAYMDVNWTDVTAASVASVNVLRAQGVNLLVDWTNLGVGRAPLLLRDVSRQTGMKILSPTGIYKSLIPPAFLNMTIDEIAGRFYEELTTGIDGGPIRANWIKIATTESGPTKTDTRIHRAAARAARKAGVTISAHTPFTDATLAVVKTLTSEGFDLRRFVWGHAQPSPVEDHIKLAKRGAMVEYDAISTDEDTFFHGPTDDESMLVRIQAMVDAGFGDRVMVTTDSSVFVNPAIYQYDRHSEYLYGTFAPKLRARIGVAAANTILRDNVIYAFRKGSRVP
jgi:phosphotriesterase-related protein